MESTAGYFSFSVLGILFHFQKKKTYAETDLGFKTYMITPPLPVRKNEV